MALFGRQRPARGDPHPPLHPGAFWSWWRSARDDVAAAIDRDAPAKLHALLQPRVHALHPELLWQVGAGRRSGHALVVSGSRRPALRPLTERWLAAGPPADDEWEYYPAVPADPEAFTARVIVGDQEIDADQAVALVETDDRHCRLDLVVYHPIMTEIGEPEQRTLAEILVLWALGEDDTDRWIGQIATAQSRPWDSIPVSLLGSVVGQAGTRWGGERWAMIEGSFGNRRLIASVRHPLHRVDHPLFDEHLAVRLPYDDQRPDGLPSERALGDLLALEEGLSSRLGAAALMVAQQTASGERLLHFYADSTASPLRTVRSLLPGYVGQLATASATYDPGWESIEHLRP